MPLSAGAPAKINVPASCGTQLLLLKKGKALGTGKRLPASCVCCEPNEELSFAAIEGCSALGLSFFELARIYGAAVADQIIYQLVEC